MPDYQLQDDEEFALARNYSSNRKTWRQNPAHNNNPVLLMEASQENRTCALESELQLSPSGRIRTNLTQSQNLEDRRTTSIAENDPRTVTTVAPPPHTAHESSFLLPNLASGSSVVSGYQNCAAEALRYLVEEEGMSTDDPLVVGLRQHLSAQQRRLDPDTVFRNYVAAMTQRLMDDHDDVTDDDLSDCGEQDEIEEVGVEDTWRHLAADICDAFFYNNSKMNTEECDMQEPEVRWFETVAPPAHYEPMCEDYGDVIGAPSPAPSI